MKVKFAGREYEARLSGTVTKSKKTRRSKYSKCLICEETRYITRHHIKMNGHQIKDIIKNIKITVPLCPLHHLALHSGDINLKIISTGWEEC